MRNLVLGTALGYDYNRIAPFVASLRETGYADDIALVVGSPDPLTRRALAQHEVTLISAATRGMSDEGLASFLTTDEERISPLYVQTKRFLIYLRYLAQHEGEIDEVLLCDVGDVFFQRPPFDYAHAKDTLSCAIEDRTIGQCDTNSRWVLEAFDHEMLDVLAPLAASCSGTTIGSYHCLRAYLTQMVALIVKHPRSGRGVDQGFHNYVIHRGAIPDLHFCSNRDGPFLTLDSVYDWTVSASGEVLLPSGAVAPIVHQFNRHPELVTLAHRRFAPGLPLSTTLKIIRRLRVAWAKRRRD